MQQSALLLRFVQFCHVLHIPRHDASTVGHIKVRMTSNSFSLFFLNFGFSRFPDVFTTINVRLRWAFNGLSFDCLAPYRPQWYSAHSSMTHAFFGKNHAMVRVHVLSTTIIHWVDICSHWHWLPNSVRPFSSLAPHGAMCHRNNCSKLTITTTKHWPKSMTIP